METANDEISSPISIVSYGRSGTSLLSWVLGNHPDVDFIGETAQMVFWTWLAVEQSHTVVRTNGDKPQAVTRESAVFCGEAVRSVFRGLFPSTKKYILQKPIGMPEAFWYLKLKKIECAAWYWNALNHSFPDGKFLTILRNPLDVAISAALFWNVPLRDVLLQLGEMADLITHKDSKIDYAVEYDRLVAEPEAQIRALCRHLSLDFHPAMLEALATRHVPQKEDVNYGAASAELNKCIESEEARAALRKIEAMWARFGADPANIRKNAKYLAAS